MSFSRYPDYKKTDAEFIGDIPVHWKVEPLKRCAEVFPSNVDKKSVDGQVPVKLCNYTDVYYSQTIIEGMSFMSATATPEQIRRFKLRKDDVVFTKDSESADDIGIAAYVSKNMDGVIYGYHLSVARPGKALKGIFLKRVFDSQEMRSHFAISANGLTRVGLGQYAVDNAPVALPPLDEQEKIAAFLDHETAKIDALIAEQQRLIELLKEKRQAVISHAVTKGLNPNAPMKDSGVEWLGEVPAHWRVARLKQASSFITSGPRGWSDYIADEGNDVFLQSGDLDNEMNVKCSSAKRISPPKGAEGVRTKAREGDVLVCITGANTGRVGVVHNLSRDTYINQHLALMRVKERIIKSDFLAFSLSSNQGKTYFSVAQYGLKEGLSLTNVENVPVCIPPVDEQEIIIECLRVELQKLSELFEVSNIAIRLLSERRSALISAAVTGKIDVRSWLPSETACPETVLKAAEEAASYG